MTTTEWYYKHHHHQRMEHFLLSVSQTQTVVRSPSGEVTAACSQNDIYEESHDCSTDEPRDRNCDKPSDEDVPEQTPVNWFSWAQPSHCHHRSHLCSHDAEIKWPHDLIFHYAKLSERGQSEKWRLGLRHKGSIFAKTRNRICVRQELFPKTAEQLEYLWKLPCTRKSILLTEKVENAKREIEC